MFEIYFTRWDNCKMRVRAAEAGCTRITCALDDENEEKYSFTVNVKLIEVKPVESRPWHKYLILCIFPEVCKYLYSISIPSSPALGLSIYCFFRYWRPRPVPGPWPLKDALDWQWHWCLQAHISDRNPLSLHFQSWILQNHNIFLYENSKTVHRIWDMEYGTLYGTGHHTTPGFIPNCRFWKYVCPRKSFRFKVLQNVFDPDFSNLDKTPTDKGQEVWSSRLISAQSPVWSAWFYCGWLTADWLRSSH